MDIISYLLARSYVKKTLAGVGAIKGKPCQIQNIEPITGGKRVTFLWVDNSNVEHTSTMDVMNGLRGEQGLQGIQGPQGPAGVAGPQGAQGAQGIAGAKGDKGDKGDTGNTGAKGDDGVSATIRIGNVTSGESVSVNNVGTNTDAVFDFTLPKGDKGDKGDKGEDGADGKSFEIKARFQTEQELIAAYPDGPDNPSDAYFVGTTTSPDLYTWLSDDHEWFNNGPIAGVKGDKGDTGDDGFSPVASVSKSGKVATISIRDKVGQTTTTVNDGEDGAEGKSAYEVAVDEGFVGTEAEWLASLVGPQGIQGPQGLQGIQGEQGIQGPVGPAGAGLPEGGTTGQTLTKKSATDYDYEWTSLGTASLKDSTDVVRPNDHALVESNAVANAINQALTSVYTPRGDLSCAELTSELLIADNVGNVYEMSDSGTTSALFIQGAGISISAGNNVGIIKASADTYMFNYMGNSFDLHDYQKKDLASAIEGATTVEGALGALSTNKADKVSSATAGDIATLDANGNLVDSGASIKNGGTKVLALKGNDNIHPADLNDLTEAGVYSIISQGSSHLPNDAFTWWQIIVITKSNTSANQGYCTQYAMARNNLVYMRDCEAGTWSSWEKLITESEFKSYGIKTIWTGSKTKGDTGMNFDASPYDLCFAQVGGTLCMLISGMGGGTSTRKKFTTVYAGRDNTTNLPYQQYYLLDILGDGTVATCGWFDLSAMDIQNSRLAGQKALELALAGTTTWTDPTWKYLNNVETSVNVTKIIGIKFQAKS